MQVDCEVEVEVEEVSVVEVVQREQEGSSVWLLLSICSLVGLEDVAASEAVKALPVCVCYARRTPKVVEDRTTFEEELTKSRSVSR